jgi:hypothetical protein
MELILVLLVAEGLILYLNSKAKFSEVQLLKKWKTGDLSYPEIVSLQEFKAYFLRQINPTIQLGKHPGLLKKHS